jgi:CRISPR/Cas system-associated exonuclease Cas4 (RecB family)
MGALPRSSHTDRWTSVSDLAEYAYCPRALYYRYHPPPEGPEPSEEESAHRGERYHRRTARAVRWRDRALPAAVGLIAAGTLLLLLLYVFGSLGG